MTKTYTYDSDALAEERDSNTTIPVQIELDISIDADHHVTWCINSIFDLDDPKDPKAMTTAFASPDFTKEIFSQAQSLIDSDAENGDLYSEWAAHLQGEADYLLEGDR